VETRQFSKRSAIQGAGISWPDNATMFWNAEGILLIDYMSHKLTVT